MSFVQICQRAGLAALLCQLGTGLAPAAAQPASGAEVARADFIKTMDAEFRRRDGDGNGMVTRAELERFEQAGLLAASREANRKLFAELDADRSGSLSAAEFSALAKAPPLPDVGGQMARLDPNRDQQVSLIEYRAATLVNFDRLDTDHDGVVTAAEMKAGKVAAKPR